MDAVVVVEPEVVVVLTVVVPEVVVVETVVGVLEVVETVVGVELVVEPEVVVVETVVGVLEVVDVVGEPTLSTFISCLLGAPGNVISKSSSPPFATFVSIRNPVSYML